MLPSSIRPQNQTPLIALLPILVAVWLLAGCRYEPAKVEGGTVRTFLLLAADKDVAPGTDTTPDSCVSIPQVLHVHDKDVIAFFSPDHAARVGRLNSLPIRDRQAAISLHLPDEFPIKSPERDPVPLTAQDSLQVPKGAIRTIRINEGAKGTYVLGVECGGFPDDPPGLVVW